jgi:ribosomal protein S27AE
MSRIDQTRRCILGAALHAQHPIRVDRKIWELAFPRPGSGSDQHGIAAAVKTIALAMGGNRPESTQDEQASGFCRGNGLRFWHDAMTQDVWVEKIPPEMPAVPNNDSMILPPACMECGSVMRQTKAGWCCGACGHRDKEPNAGGDR